MKAAGVKDQAIYQAIAEAYGDTMKTNAAIGAAINRAAKELPEGWGIDIQIEKGSGTVDLHKDFEPVEYDSDHEYLSDSINDAIDHALKEEA